MTLVIIVVIVVRLYNDSLIYINNTNVNKIIIDPTISNTIPSMLALCAMRIMFFILIDVTFAVL